MSYDLLRRGGVAHKMDSNFSMLGAKIDHWNACYKLFFKTIFKIRGLPNGYNHCKNCIIMSDQFLVYRLQLSRIFRDSHGIDCFVTGHRRPYHMPIVCHRSV